MTWNDFLDRVAASMPDVDWTDVLPAVLAGVVTVVVIRFGLRVVIQRLRALSERTRTSLDDALVHVLEQTNGALIWIVGLLVGLTVLPLDDRWHGRVSQLWFAVVALQIGLWCQQALSQALLAHVLGHFLDALIVETIFDVFAHDVANFGIRPLPFCHAADRDIPIGDHSHQAVVLAHRKHAGI